MSCRDCRFRGGAKLKASQASTTPNEAPLHAEITLDTVAHTPEENARRIFGCLLERGFVRGNAPAAKAAPV
jgi:adenylylsulfate kinase-like enzyme